MIALCAVNYVLCVLKDKLNPQKVEMQKPAFDGIFIGKMLKAALSGVEGW